MFVLVKTILSLFNLHGLGGTGDGRDGPTSVMVFKFLLNGCIPGLNVTAESKDSEPDDNLRGVPVYDENRENESAVGDGDGDEVGEDAMFLEDELDVAGADDFAAGVDDDELDVAGADSDVLL